MSRRLVSKTLNHRVARHDKEGNQAALSSRTKVRDLKIYRVNKKARLITQPGFAV